MALTLLSQSEEEQIINNVINTEIFIKHLSNQEIFDLKRVDYILPNKYTKTTWQIFFLNKNIEFNTEVNKTALGFDRGYDFEIINFRKQRKKASIYLNFYPSYFPCSNESDAYTSQSHAFYLSIHAELIKEEGNWTIVTFSISDDSFEVNKEQEPCIYYKYKKFV
jgi:hypothetical protein